jgi:hypothetical protein
MEGFPPAGRSVLRTGRSDLPWDHPEAELSICSSSISTGLAVGARGITVALALDHKAHALAIYVKRNRREERIDRIH